MMPCVRDFTRELLHDSAEERPSAEICLRILVEYHKAQLQPRIIERGRGESHQAVYV